MPIVLHIPHSSTIVPDEVRDQFVIDPEELDEEVDRLTDHETDRIFTKAFPDATACVFPVSRFVVDPERFVDDSKEPMAASGMGVVYTHGTRRQPIRRGLTHDERRSLLREYYRPHHEALTQAVQRCLDRHDKCLVLDCHSFPSKALPCEHFQDARRPEFCLGTDEFHTPVALVANVERELSRQGYSVLRNEPFPGCLVPMEYFQRDGRVRSLMIEVNRNLYMGDDYSVREQRLDRVIVVLRALRPTISGSF